MKQKLLLFFLCISSIGYGMENDTFAKNLARFSQTKALKILEVPMPANFNGTCDESLKGTITKNYKKKAVKDHPDKNGNTPEATAKFKDIQHAYEILTNPENFEFPMEIKIPTFDTTTINQIYFNEEWYVEGNSLFPKAYETGYLIHWAIKNNTLDFLKTLLDAGADTKTITKIPYKFVTEKDQYGYITRHFWLYHQYSAVAYAVALNKKEAFDLLMEHNAYIGNPTFESYIDHESPLDIAYKSEDPYFKCELLKQGATRSNTIINKNFAYGLICLLSIFKCLEDYEYTNARKTLKKDKLNLESKTQQQDSKEPVATNFNLYRYVLNIFKAPKKHKRLLILPTMLFFYLATNNFATKGGVSC